MFIHGALFLSAVNSYYTHPSPTMASKIVWFLARLK